MKPIIINEWQKGIGASSPVGFSDLRCLDIYSRPGKAIINFATSKKSGTTVTGLVRWFAVDTVNDRIYALDDAGDLYRSTDQGDSWTKLNVQSTSSATGNGLAVWKGYLFVARNTNLDVFGALNAVTANLGWQSLTNDYYHTMFVGSAGNGGTLYIANGRYLASLEEKAGATFDPTNSATYTFTAQALDFNYGYRVKSMAELRDKLLIGTFKSDGNQPKYQSGDIFPWDTSSSTYNLPIRLNVSGVNAMININNNVYVQGGTKGEWFITNGLVAQKVRGLPYDLVTLDGDSALRQEPGAVIQHKGGLYFGIGNAGAGTGLVPQGVWSLNGSSLNFEHKISTGSVGDTGQVIIGALQGVGTDSMLIGWSDAATTFGIDKVSISSRYTSYGAYAISPLYHVGTKLNNKTFDTLEVQLAKPLTTGQGIRVSWRNDPTGSFTVLGTFDYATYGAKTGWEVGAGSIDNCEVLQIKVEMTTTNSTTPELLAVILK